MSKQNVRVGKRASLAAVAAFLGVLALSSPAGAAPAGPFREVVLAKWPQYLQSDGARFAWATSSPGLEHGVVRVFDTLRGRSFRLEAPRPDCSFGAIGGGLAVWTCLSPHTMLLTNLSTGRSREPSGIDQVEQLEIPQYNLYCRAFAVGRYWLGFSCGNGFGPGDDPHYLNHRTGRLTDYFDPFSAEIPFIDPDYVDLFRPYCAPLERPSDGAHAPPYFDYAPPFALHAPAGTDPRMELILLRRCGTRHAEILSRCRFTDCRTPQLGSRYVTWGEHKRVYAYLPSIRRRLLVGRAPADFVRGRKLYVAHTCKRVFAVWGNTIYAARFEPRRGAPPCQTPR